MNRNQIVPTTVSTPVAPLEGSRLPPAEPPRPQSSPRPVASAPAQSSPKSREIQQLVTQMVSTTSDDVQTKALEALINYGQDGIQAVAAVATNKNAPAAQRGIALQALSLVPYLTSDANITSMGLIAADTSELPQVSSAALKTLGTLINIRAVRELCALAGKGGSLGFAAIKALSESPAMLQGVAPQLTNLYQNGTTEARQALLPRLAELKDQTAIRLVSEALSAPSVPASVKESVVQKLSSPEYAQTAYLPALSKLLSPSMTANLREGASLAIGQTALSYNLKGTDPSLSSLRLVADTASDPLQPAATVLVATLNGDEQARITTARSSNVELTWRINALNSLTSPSAKILPALRELAQQPTPPHQVRIAAASALGRAAPDTRDQGATLITKILSEKISQEARSQGLEALLELSPAQGIEQVKGSLVRQIITPDTAATLLTHQRPPLPSTLTTPVLLDLLKKLPPESESTGQIINALGKSGDPRTIPHLQANQRGAKPSSLNADQLLASLARLGDGNAVEQTLSRLSGSLTDSKLFLESLAASPHLLASAALATRLQTLNPIAQILWRDALEGLSLSNKIAFGERLTKAAEAETDPARSSFLRAYGNAIVAATTKLDIQSPFRYPPEFLIQAVDQRLSPAVDGRPLATVITPRDDHNGAFNGRSPHFTELQRAGYRVMLYEVATDKEAVQALQMATAQGQKADLVMFYGHGSQQSLALGAPDPRLVRPNDSTGNDPGVLSIKDEGLLRQASHTLRPGGPVIAISCSLGEGGRGADNMASFLRRVFPHARTDGIYTLTDASGWEEIRFTAPRTWNVRSSVDVLQSTRPTRSPGEEPGEEKVA